MEKLADVGHPVHDLIPRRWSPRAFAARPVEPEVLGSLFAAARWAPSSYNAPPWYYLVAQKENTAEFEHMLHCLVEGNIAWAKNAPVLMISVAKLTFDHDGSPNRHALHDGGQASAQLMLEAVSRGLFVHQMAGILAEKIRKTYKIHEGWEPVAGFALGYPGDPERLPDGLRERESAPRARKPLQSFVFSGQRGGNLAGGQIARVSARERRLGEARLSFAGEGGEPSATGSFFLSRATLWSAHSHVRLDRHSRPEQVLGVLSFFENDLDRNALHNLDIIAGGILRRQQAIARPG